MHVQEAIAKRRSIRKYLDKPVPEDALRRVLEAARLAPSARNRQEWKFIVVRDPAVKLRVLETTNREHPAGTAPIVLAFCYSGGEAPMSNGEPAGTVDTSIALSYVTLAAVEEGLGTCWLGSYDSAKVGAALGLPAGAKVVALTPLGYPAEDPPPRPRKPFDEVVGFDRW